MARKLVKKDFDVLAPPPKKYLGGVQNFLSKMKKNKVVQNCLKWRENWSKRIYGPFSPPIKIFGGRTKNFVKNEKNESCSVIA